MHLQYVLPFSPNRKKYILGKFQLHQASPGPVYLTKNTASLWDLKDGLIST